MPTSNYSAFHPCLERVSATSRTAVYGPVRTVVWEGRSREAPPYPDHWPTAGATLAARGGRVLGGTCRGLPSLVAAVDEIVLKGAHHVPWPRCLRRSFSTTYSERALASRWRP